MFSNVGLKICDTILFLYLGYLLIPKIVLDGYPPYRKMMTRVCTIGHKFYHHTLWNIHHSFHFVEAIHK